LKIIFLLLLALGLHANNEIFVTVEKEAKNDSKASMYKLGYIYLSCAESLIDYNNCITKTSFKLSFSREIF